MGYSPQLWLFELGNLWLASARIHWLIITSPMSWHHWKDTIHSKKHTHVAYLFLLVMYLFISHHIPWYSRKKCQIFTWYFHDSPVEWISQHQDENAELPTASSTSTSSSFAEQVGRAGLPRIHRSWCREFTKRGRTPKAMALEDHVDFVTWAFLVFFWLNL